MNTLNKEIKSKFAALAIVAGALFAPGIASAGEEHADHKDGGHMMDKQQMTEAMGTGRINKVMAKHNMVNISHEAIKALNWPKMKMNFTTSDKVKLDKLEPGQLVNFKLQVDKDNNYLVTEINVVK